MSHNKRVPPPPIPPLLRAKKVSSRYYYSQMFFAIDSHGFHCILQESDGLWGWDDGEKRRKASKEDPKMDKFAAFRQRKPPNEEFRRPREPPLHFRKNRRGGKAPDFRKNPQKYTKYSLEDVDVTDNAGNSAAAFEFLRQLDGRKRKMEEIEGDREEKVLFKQPVKKRDGVEGKKEKKPSSKGPTLSHLMDEDEEEDD